MVKEIANGSLVREVIENTKLTDEEYISMIVSELIKTEEYEERVYVGMAIVLIVFIKEEQSK